MRVHSWHFALEYNKLLYPEFICHLSFKAWDPLNNQGFFHRNLEKSLNFESVVYLV